MEWCSEYTKWKPHISTQNSNDSICYKQHTFMSTNKCTKRSKKLHSNYKAWWIRKDSISSPKFYVAFYLGQKQKPTTKPALNPLPSLAAVCLNSHCDHSPFIWAHWLPNQVSPESGHPCATEVRAGEWETSGRWVTVARVRVPPSWRAVQSYSRNSQNLLNFAQQTSEDDPRLSLILTTLKKEENTQIFWVKKWIWKYWQSTFPK